MNSTAERASDHESVNFYEQLVKASTDHEKFAPLWRQAETERGGGIIRIKTLQHMNVIHIRKLLAEEVAIMVRRQNTDYEQMRSIEDLMSRYTSALRDLKFLLERPSQDDRIADFLRNLQYINARDDQEILLASNLLKPESLEQKVKLKVPDYTGWNGYRHHQDNDRQRFDRFVRRLLTALVGGLALIGPMLIMQLHPTLLTQLLTASLFILAFGCALAWFLENTDEMYIASATAAYAAVLVVFVGASSTS